MGDSRLEVDPPPFPTFPFLVWSKVALGDEGRDELGEVGREELGEGVRDVFARDFVLLVSFSWDPYRLAGPDGRGFW